MDSRPWRIDPDILFVTGRLAEFALRQVLDDLRPAAGFDGRGRRPADLGRRPDDARSGSPGTWRSPPASTASSCPATAGATWRRSVEKAAGTAVERGPEDLRDLPRYLRPGRRDGARATARIDIEILAEINHAPRLASTS